jgi:DNA-binding PadR family transcriptional regulator
LKANTLFYNLTTALVMMIGRFGLAIPALALAGLVAGQITRRETVNAVPTRYDTTHDVIAMRDPSLLVLASLAGGKKHGYAIMQDIRSFAGVSLGPGTLYGAITRLERRGLIRPVDSKDRRQPYAITSAGRAYLNSRLASLGRVVRIGLQRLQNA